MILVFNFSFLPSCLILFTKESRKKCIVWKWFAEELVNMKLNVEDMFLELVEDMEVVRKEVNGLKLMFLEIVFVLALVFVAKIMYWGL